MKDWNPEGLPGFFERLRNLSAIRRFGTLPSAHPDSVANHSFDVAVLAMMIADREGDPTLSVERILRKALWHDFEETIVSDIPHPIKHRYQGGRLGLLLEEIVATVLENEAFHELPDDLSRRYASDAKDAKRGREGEVVAAADAMDLVIVATREIKMGNRYFEHIFDVGMKLCEKHRQFRLVDEFCRVARDYLEKGQFVDGVFHENRTTQTDLFSPGA
ncbi:MAG: HD domain-containing protein [Fibrobacterota bacterium]|nr:HD domain-containing protein [Fibrobacterota bacterium]QQS04775.1 MAG: HD domain-containing protein [Fibrobacterota bacterium]